MRIGWLLSWVVLLPTTLQAAPLRDVDVIHYDVALVPDIAAKQLSGQQTVQLRSLAPALTEVVLDSGTLQVSAVSRNGKPLSFHQPDGTLRIALDAPLKRGRTVTLQIAYAGKPTYGLEFAPARNEVYTVFSTSQWMPSVDAPDERATLALAVTLPAGLLATGTGRPLPARVLRDGRVQHRWRLTSPMPAYVYGFAAGRYQQATAQHRGIRLRFLSVDRSPSELRAVFAQTGAMLDFFAERAGVSYRGEYQQALVAETIGQEMAGLSLLSEDYGREVLEDPTRTALIAHEAAHQWWGNRVTCASWQHFWLNEGFANFMTAAYLQHAQGEAAYQAHVQRWRAKVDTLRAKGADHALVYASWDAPSGDDRAVVYQKGAYVLHLLREALGDAVFWQGMRDYTRAHDGRSVVTGDFQRAMEHAAGRSLQPFFDQWVYGHSATPCVAAQPCSP